MTKPEFAQTIKQKYPQYQNVSDEELVQLVVSKYPEYQSQIEQGADVSLGEYAMNWPKSAVTNAKQIGSALWNVTNPDPQQNTAVNLTELALEGSQFLGNPLARSTQEGLGLDPNADKLRGLGQYYGQRYGLLNESGEFDPSLDRLSQTAYEDPVGVLLDVVPAGKASKVGKAGEAARAASVAEDLGVFRKSLNKASDFLSERALRASPSQLDNFEDVAKMPAGQYIRENKLWGGAGNLKPVNRAIENAQAQYNNLVRTGGEIPTKLYTDALRERAVEMLNSNLSREGRALAERLWKEADVQERIAPTIKDSTLTNTKSGLLSKGVDDSMTKSFRQEEGLAGIRALDKYAPGSGQIGKKLQELRTFKDITKKQGKLGRGSQIINGIKGPATAGGTGAIVGAFVGNPIAGAAIGAGVAGLANSRRVQSGVAQALAGQLKIANTTGKVFNKSVQAVTPVRGFLEEQRKKVKDQGSIMRR